jgi:hypothetical protein
MASAAPMRAGPPRNNASAAFLRGRRRFWIEVAIASLTGLLALITPIFPDWIELISGWDPDQHDGSIESLILLGLFIVTAIIFGLALAEWRRTPATA